MCTEGAQESFELDAWEGFLEEVASEQASRDGQDFGR